ncbi:class I SAM-dependent methyltransferase [Vibrio ostreae]|uniref:Class I SAM-dependent methyltransferase n=1 Tax=Vibrio ostreae TaxID=2841925 RepID=A0A975UA03_9VIBR|nr:class I SAM-dependent methyltransferase [Vibrio ostreae]QXO17286.1 class I SAM-dependent methyltransferase [Vibrio ostreae]
MISSEEFWNKNSQKYIAKPIKDKNTYNKKLKITEDLLSSTDRILEVGCGSGETAIYHAKNVKHVLATDISAAMVQHGIEKSKQAGLRNIDFKQVAIEDLLEEAERFDAILALNVLHLVNDVEASLKIIYELLHDNGLFVSSTPLLLEVNPILKILISIMQKLNLAPPVSMLSNKGFISLLENVGFKIEMTWKSSKESMFIVAYKNGKKFAEF